MDELSPEVEDTVRVRPRVEPELPFDPSSIEADTVILSAEEIRSELRAPSFAAPGGSRLNSSRPPEPAGEMVAKIHVGSHEAISLDRPTIIGRAPNPPRILQGIAPRLVMVPSPMKEVSASHVEFRQTGASVVLTDLGSTNGTRILPPNGANRLLRQGESTVILDGTIVEIGDGIRILLERSDSQTVRSGISDSEG
ncbi:MAG: FHA domain-containing protein [Cryobacterium sp.]|nr:FHA domain-containing protein [Cryobacterium sp.]MBX3090345.1 FHA domain-containing protein [Cryobacterium sp.]MBX3116490.1 FHA domain-containing protein [Cryobacterium sp.]MCO5293691.1 FHA domain-containing protein [Homoserinimonas sp.]